MKPEFKTLSSKAQRNDVGTDTKVSVYDGNYYYPEKDIKEFIQQLKDESCDIARERVPNHMNEITYHQLLKLIDKLAGSRFTK